MKYLGTGQRSPCLYASAAFPSRKLIWKYWQKWEFTQTRTEIIWKTLIGVPDIPLTYKGLSGNTCFAFFLLAGKSLQSFSCDIPLFISFADRWLTGIFPSLRIPVQSFFLLLSVLFGGV